MTLKQRRKEVKQEKQKGPSTKKKVKESDQLWKILVAFVVIIAIATATIYLVGSRNDKPLEEKIPKDTEKNEEDKSTPSHTKNKKVVKQKPKKPVITNKYDKTISEELKSADKFLKKKDFDRAKRAFEALIKNHPDSPRAMHGLAKSLDELAEVRRSNEVLQQAIDAFGKVGKIKNCPSALKRMAGLRQAERLAFLGSSSVAAKVLLELAQGLSSDVEVWNKLGVQYLIMGKNRRAKETFEKVLKINPNDGFGQVHLAFVLKSESNYEDCIPFFEKGLASGEKGTDESKFYFHLGDAYYRLGNKQKAYEVYEKGAKNGHFLSKMQRSLYNADTPLRPKPFWKPEETPYITSIRMLENNWKVIRDEGLALYDPKKEAFVNEDEGLRETGSWQQFTMFSQGRKDPKACLRAPKTCKLVEKIHDAASCKRGQIKFSVMKPGTHIWAHCGPTNCRIRGHLGLVIPKGVLIRVADETSTWKEGKMIFLDDSIEHEVWHNGTTFRMILIIDFWHPDLTQKQRNTLSPI